MLNFVGGVGKTAEQGQTFMNRLNFHTRDPEKIKHFENKEAERQRGRGLYFLKEKKDPKTALIKPNSSIAAHTIINPQPSVNPTLLRFQSLKPHDVASFAWCSDGRACLHSSFAGTPPHCWECRAGSYSSFRTALISLDIVGFLHNGRKSFKEGPVNTEKSIRLWFSVPSFYFIMDSCLQFGKSPVH